jgi:hypothetical protein
MRGRSRVPQIQIVQRSVQVISARRLLQHRYVRRRLPAAWQENQRKCEGHHRKIRHFRHDLNHLIVHLKTTLIFPEQIS